MRPIEPGQAPVAVSAAPRVTVAAPPAQVAGLVFPAFKHEPGTLIGYQVQSTARQRIVEVDSNALAETETSLDRFEALSVRADGGREKTVAYDTSRTRALDGKETSWKAGYKVVRPPGDAPLEVVADKDSSLSAERREEIRKREANGETLQALVDFLARQRFSTGVAVPLPEPLLARFEGKRGTAKLLRVEARWQTQVAAFELEGANDEATFRGELFVEVATGFPLVARTLTRSEREVSADGHKYRSRGVMTSARRWGRLSANDRSSPQIAAEPPPAPLTPSALDVTQDGSFAVTLASESGHASVQAWDLAARRVTNSLPTSGAALALHDSAVFAASVAGVEAFLLSSGGALSSMGNVVFGGKYAMQLGEPRAGAVLLNHALFAHERGYLSLTLPQHRCIAAVEKLTDLTPAALAAEPSGRRLVVAGVGGEVILLEARERPAGSDEVLPCRQLMGFRELGRVRLELENPTSVSFAGRSALVASAEGEVVAIEFPEKGAARVEPLGRLGTKVARDPGNPGKFLTERGAFTLAEKQHPAPPAPGLGGPVGLLPERGLGVRIVAGQPVLFAPGTTRETRAPSRAAFAPDELDWQNETLAARSHGPTSVEETRFDLRTGELDTQRLQRASTGSALVAASKLDASDGRHFELTPAGALKITQGSKILFDEPVSRAGHSARLVLSRDARKVAVLDSLSLSSSWNPMIPVVQVRDAASGKLEVELSPVWGSQRAGFFARDGLTFVAADDSGRLTVWDLASGQIIEAFAAHQGSVTSLIELPERGLFASAGLDGVVNIWSRDALFEKPTTSNPVFDLLAPQRPTKKVATLFAGAREGGMIATGDGYYLSSRGNLRGLRLVSASRAYEFEQFDGILNRPDVVLERLGIAAEQLEIYRAAQQKRQARAGRERPRVVVQNPPEVSVEGAPLGFAEHRNLRLTIRAKSGAATEHSATAKLARLHVRVNSVAETPPEGAALSGETSELTREIALGRGQNRIEIYVEDERGAPSRVVTTVVDLVAPQAASRLFVLAVGVSDYADDRLDLAYAAKDAKDLAERFAKSARFAETRVRLLVDKEATAQNISDSRKFLEEAKEDDTVLLFFAGHGFLDAARDYFFATTDIRLAAPTEKALSYGKLTALVQGLRARQRIVMLDTCHAGETDRSAKQAVPASGKNVTQKGFRGLVLGENDDFAKSFELMRALFFDQNDGSGAIVISSSGGAEYAYEKDEQKNGVFTHALLRALGNASLDGNADSSVALSEVFAGLESEVRSLTGGAQHPNIRTGNLDLDPILY